VRRKGEITRILREWPHHVALEASKVVGSNHQVVNDFARALSVGPLGYSLRSDDVDYVVFCFAKPEDAEVFCKQFDGELVQKVGRR
jgi:hypothetical protein